jgi:hypothetical protein
VNKIVLKRRADVHRDEHRDQDSSPAMHGKELLRKRLIVCGHCGHFKHSEDRRRSAVGRVRPISNERLNDQQ